MTQQSSHPPRVPAEQFLIPTRAAFLQLLDLTRPELASVGSALERGDVTAAGIAWIAHFRSRQDRSLLVTHWDGLPRQPQRVSAIAQDALRGRLFDGYNVYDVPPTGIDWYDCPLFCLPRFPVFSSLMQAFHHSGDPRYLRFVIEHSLQFIAAYPIAAYAGTHSDEGYRNHYVVGPPTWWCLLPNRLEAWVEAVDLARRSPLVSDEELLTILQRMAQEARYLLTQVPYWLGQGHNAACIQIRVTAMLAWLFADFREAACWGDQAGRWLVEYLEGAFYPDGLFKELTTGYSCSVVRQTARVACALGDVPAVAALRQRVISNLTALVALAGPSRRVPALGDHLGQPISGFLEEKVVHWLDDPWLNWVQQSLLEEAPPGEASPAVAAPQQSRCLVWPAAANQAWGGYYAMRSDWSPQARYLLVDGGPWGTAHQHMDKLSFVLSAYGGDFLTDPSCTMYANNEPDARLSTLHAGFVHNGLTIDGIDQFVASPPFWQTGQALDNRWEHGPSYTLFSAWFDFSPLKAVRWERRIVFVDGAYWWLQDVLTASPGSDPGSDPGAAPVAVEMSFPFEQDVTVASDAGGATARAANGASLRLLPLDHAPQQAVVIGEETPRKTYSTQYGAFDQPREMGHGRGWIARFNKRIIAAPALTWALNCSLPAVLTTALIPAPPAPGQPVLAAPIITAQRQGSAVRWRLPTRAGALELIASEREFRLLS